jgi:hypothetical protein
MTTEAVEWIPAAGRLPDADLNVLCFDAESMAVCEGFLDGEHDDGSPLWRDVTAVTLGCVTHWAEMPRGPLDEISDE